MIIRRGGICLADLGRARGTEPGKLRPVLVVQTNLLNGHHRSTLVCPLTSRVDRTLRRLRVHVRRGEGGLAADSDVLVDQLRAIDNRRFREVLGQVAAETVRAVSENLRIMLDLP